MLDKDSKAFPGIGAAVHVPAHPDKQQQQQTVAVDCMFESEPGAPACVNTINRAELAAIRVAVKIGQGSQPGLLTANPNS